MFLRCNTRRKDGKLHRYWGVVENGRTRHGKIVQRHVRNRGEINDAQRAAWCRTIEVLEGPGAGAVQTAEPELPAAVAERHRLAQAMLSAAPDPPGDPGLDVGLGPAHGTGAEGELGRKAR